MIPRTTSRLLQFAACVALSAGVGSTLLAADWTQYRNGSHGAATSEPAIATAFGKGKSPKVLWKVPTGEGFGTFAVAGKDAYIFVDRQMRETLVAMDANTGKERWARPVDQTITDRAGGSNPRSTPTIDGDAVYVYSVNLKLSCRRAKDGSVAWEHDLMKEMNGQKLKWGNATSPVLDEDRIFVGGGGSGKSMAAFDKKTGKVIWAVGDEQLTHASPVVGTIHGVRQVIFFMQSGLVSLDVKTGKLLWRYAFPFNTSTASSPVIGTGNDEGIVYCSAGYGVGSAACQVAKQGNGYKVTELWKIDDGGKVGPNTNHWSTPLYHDGHIYGIFGFKDFSTPGNNSKGGPARCLDIKTGQFKWTQPGFGSGGGTILVDQYLLLQGDAGRLSLVEANPAGFKELGTMTLPGEKFWSAAIVANGKIYARSKKEAFCLDLGVK